MMMSVFNSGEMVYTVDGKLAEYVAPIKQREAVYRIAINGGKDE